MDEGIYVEMFEICQSNKIHDSWVKVFGNLMVNGKVLGSGNILLF